MKCSITKKRLWYPKKYLPVFYSLSLYLNHTSWKRSHWTQNLWFSKPGDVEIALLVKMKISWWKKNYLCTIIVCHIFVRYISICFCKYNPNTFLFVADTYKVQVITKHILTGKKNKTHSFHQRCSMMSEKRAQLLTHWNFFKYTMIFQNSSKIRHPFEKHLLPTRPGVFKVTCN